MDDILVDEDDILVDEIGGWCRAALKPPPLVRYSEAVEGNRVLAGPSVSAPGPFRFEKTPYWREPLDRLGPQDPVHTVVIKSSAQVGKTELGFNWEWCIPQYAPGTLIHMLPTEEVVKRTVSDRFNPMVDASPELRSLFFEVEDGRGQGSRSRAVAKQFPGGVFYFSWPTPPMLSSTPARYIFADEIDRIGDTSEGDSIALLERRTTTFPRRKILLVSTPTIAGQSRIDEWFQRGDQRRWNVPCPLCGSYQVLKWEQVQILERGPDGMPAPGAVQYLCEHCEQLFEEKHKPAMLSAGEWLANAKGEKGITSYHLSGLYSPLGWLSWQEIAEAYVGAVHELREKKNNVRLVAVVNTMLGEVYDEAKDNSELAGFSAVDLAARAEVREPYWVPRGGEFLTLSVDTQDDRLEASVYAWGQGAECWLLGHEVIYGSPDQPGPWAYLDMMLDRTYPGEDGRTRRIAACAIDSGGHYTQDVYNYVVGRNRQRDHRVVAIKGANKRDAVPVSVGGRISVSYMGRPQETNSRLWIVGTHKIKAEMRRKFLIDSPGPGFFHMMQLPGDPDGVATFELAEQLLGEIPVTNYSRSSRGVTDWKPVKHNQRVEAWDCLVYARAQAIRLGVDSIDFSKYSQPKKTEPAKPYVVPTGAAPPAVSSAPRHEGRRQPARTQSAFLQGKRRY